MGTRWLVGEVDGVHANEFIQDVTDRFGGGGGGRPTLAQGGGLSADPETVVESLDNLD